MVGRRVDVHADLARVWATCDGKLVAEHQRVWATHQTVSDFEHLVAAKALQRDRADLVKPVPEVRNDADVQVRDLTSYDLVLGVDTDTDTDADNLPDVDQRDGAA